MKVFYGLRSGRIVAGADLSEAARKKFAKTYRSARVYVSHKDLLGDTSVDAVVVAVPTALHTSVACDALRGGSAVLCEKPMARSVSAARRMIEVCHKTKQLLMIAHCRHYDNEWDRFAALVKYGTLGKPVLWRCIKAGGSPGIWFMDDKLDGGPLFDAAVHNYDFANLIFGDQINVTAHAIKLTKHTAVDTASALVRYPQGYQLLLSRSWGAFGVGMTDAVGAKAGVIFGAGSFAGKVDTSGKASFCLGDNRTAKAKLIQFKHDPVQMYQTQAKHFLACIGGKAQCLTPATQAIKAVAVAQATLKATPIGSRSKAIW